MSLIVRTFARNLAGRPAVKIPESAPVVVPPPEITQEWMATRHVTIYSLPEALLSSAKSLFSSYSVADVREWGAKIAQYYSKYHSVEKPRDITKVQPFATSVEMLDKETEAPHRRGYFKMPKTLTGADVAGTQIPEVKSETIEHTLKYQAEHAVGYAYKRMPNTYASIYRIFHEIKHRMPDFLPNTCLDYGAGTGAASWVATTLYPDIESIAVEPAKEMRTIGKKLSKKQPNIKWAESLANLPSISEPKGIYDIVICGYVLGEIENAVTRNLILDALWQRTGKIMIFIEPGTPKGSRLIYSIRQWALNTMTREEANIVAPCPHDGDCPLAAHPKSWCHFSQFTAKYPSDVISRVKCEDTFDNEKFSYIVVKRGTIPRYYSALDQLTLAEESFLWARLVRPVIKATKHVTFDICRLNKLERIVLSKGRTERKIYRYIRKAHWGDLWPYKETNKSKEDKDKKTEKKVYINKPKPNKKLVKNKDKK